MSKEPERLRHGIKVLRCPKCAERLVDGARQCECGWSLEEQISHHGGCSYRAGAKRCKFPGSIESEGRRYCRFHYMAESLVYGEAVVEESEEWARNIAKGRPVTTHLTTERGIKYPSYVPFAQRAEAERERVHAWLKEKGLHWKSGETAKNYVVRMKKEAEKRLKSYMKKH